MTEGFTRWEAGYNSVSSLSPAPRPASLSFTRWEAGYNSVRLEGPEGPNSNVDVSLAGKLVIIV